MLCFNLNIEYMNKTEFRWFYYILLISIFLTDLDIMTNKFMKNQMIHYSPMKKLKIILILWFHIFLWILLNATTFFVVLNVFDLYKSSKIIYIVGLGIMVLITGLWVVFNNRCIVTVKFNEFIGVNPSYGYRTPFMVLSNDQSTMIKDNVLSKVGDYSINIVVILLLIYILRNKRWT